MYFPVGAVWLRLFYLSYGVNNLLLSDYDTSSCRSDAIIQENHPIS